MKPPFQITPEILSLCTDIGLLIGKCEGLQLDAPEPRLRRQNRIKTVQATLEIEGNTLSLDQVTAVLEGKHVAGPPKDILEVKNAIKAYSHIPDFDVSAVRSFLQAHRMLLNGIAEDAGRFRSSNVGVVSGERVAHVAPVYTLVPQLMDRLFAFVRDDLDTHILVKSCVVHYEIEFIHPFTDGNGRMGRLWQTAMLAGAYPVFEFVPLETVIKVHQAEYYDVLGSCDRAGDSTGFVLFMLTRIRETLEEFIRETRPSVPTPDSRLEKSRQVLQKEWFSRGQYLRIHKGISTATASRDLLYGLEHNLLEKTGEKALTKYRFRG